MSAPHPHPVTCLPSLRGSASTHLLPRVGPASSSSRGPCRWRVALLWELVRVCCALCHDRVLRVEKLSLVQAYPVLSLTQTLTPGRWPHSSSQPLPGPPAGPAALS